MTLRLTDAQAAALRAHANREGRSMRQVALSALDDYLLRAEDDELTDRLAEQGAERSACHPRATPPPQRELAGEFAVGRNPRVQDTWNCRGTRSRRRGLDAGRRLHALVAVDVLRL